MATTSRFPRLDQKEALHSYDVYLLLVFLSIVISPGPYVPQDKEEGIKEEEG